MVLTNFFQFLIFVMMFLIFEMMLYEKEHWK